MVDYKKLQSELRIIKIKSNVLVFLVRASGIFIILNILSSINIWPLLGIDINIDYHYSLISISCFYNSFILVLIRVYMREKFDKYVNALFYVSIFTFLLGFYFFILFIIKNIHLFGIFS